MENMQGLYARYDGNIGSIIIEILLYFRNTVSKFSSVTKNQNKKLYTIIMQRKLSMQNIFLQLISMILIYKQTNHQPNFHINKLVRLDYGLGIYSQ